MTTGRVLFLTKYGRRGPSSRYRVYQYLPLLRAAGLGCDVRPLLPDKYLQLLYQPGSRKSKIAQLAPLIGGALARRWRLLQHEALQYKVVVLEYEALPYLPFLFEHGLLRSGSTRVILDLDDAVYLSYQQHPNRFVRRLLQDKLPCIARESWRVVVANQNLATWAMRFNPHTTIIPTSVDLRKYSLAMVQANTNVRPVIGWIGTPITAHYLAMLAEPLRELGRKHDFTLKVIGAPEFAMDGIDVQAVAWHERSEVSELQKCNIGVMPLADDQWSRGKSALKLIQYLAAGVPAVASPIGANQDVVTDNFNGLLAATAEEWVQKLSLLLDQPALGRKLAQAGRQTVVERFSIQQNASLLLQVLEEALSTGVTAHV